MYDVLSERVALIMLAAWRGSSIVTTRAKHKPVLYDGERQRARTAPLAQPLSPVVESDQRKERQ